MSASSHPPAPAAVAPATDSLSTSDLTAVPVAPGYASFWRPAVIVGLTLFVLLAYWFNPPLTVVPQAGVVMELPPLIDDYYGSLGKITQAELDILPKDTEFARRIYADGKGHEINCSIVLSGAEQRSIHRPEACLVGQGWTVIDQKNIPVPLQSGHTLEARELTLERRVNDQNGQVLTVRAFYIYWFVGHNVTTPSHFTRILLSNWDRAVLNISHRWAYVSVFSMITDNLRPDGLDPAQTETLLTHFATQIVPTFQISEMPQQAGH